MQSADTGETIEVGNDLNEQQRTQLSEIFKRHINAFSINGQLGKANLLEHEIVLKPNAKPIAIPLRRLPQIHIEETRKQIQQM